MFNQKSKKLSVRKPKRKVAYILDIFPKLSETFVFNEIVELEKQNVEVLLFSLIRNQEAVVHPGAANLLLKTKFLEDRQGKIKKIGALILLLFLRLRNVINSYRIVKEWQDKPARYHLRQASVLALRLLCSGVQHIHAHFAMQAAEYAMFSSLLSGIPYTFTAHAYDIFLHQKLLKKKMDFAKYVFTVSNYNKKYLLKVNPDYDQHKIKIIICGVNPKEFFPLSEETTSRPNYLKILTVGRLEKKKGFTYLIEALHLIKGRNIKFKCRIVGSGSQYHILKQQIQQYNLVSDCLLLGAQNQEQVKNHLAWADVFILPSIIAQNGNRDSMPVVLQEAMAMAIPIIATNVAAIPELVRDGAGILVPPKDNRALSNAIMQFNQLPFEAKRRMGKIGRKIIARDFNIENKTIQLIKLFFKS
ncbi:MAG: glycosyltransferase [Methanosarcinaceae archaeon]